ncbi:MAG TPA: sigma 54-interacting transcriptional regulator [Syntrophomonadaceae bacterium]|nr:sigma 54-interacting transcriptional regulator [Syntrophomonadaceae bacterium]
MKIEDIMSSDLYVLKENDTLRDAAALFIDKRIDGAPVVDGDMQLRGLITKSHVLRVVAQNQNMNLLLTDVMETDVVTINPADDIDDIVHLELGRLPVTRDGELKGIITRSDLVRAYYRSVRDLEEELNTVINSTYNAIITIDLQGRVQIFNQSAQKLFGISSEEAIGKHVTKIVPDSNLAEILETGKIEPSHTIYHADKTLISNRTPVILDGKIIGAVAVLQDVSELEKVLTELYYAKELNSELDAIIESSFDGMYITDAQGRTIRVNEAYSRITGIKQEEVLGKTMDQLVEEGVYDQSASILVMKKKESVTISQEVKTGKTVLVTGNPVFDEDGNIFRIVTNVRDITELNNLRQKLEHAHSLTAHYQEQLKKHKISDKYVMRSQKSKELVDLVLRLGKVDSTVLIQGESGVGKEVIADILHSNSIRKDEPLVKINCGAIPETLLESELFGYEAGAFTGARKGGKMGIFEIADGGTLFLDEIGELSLPLQTKLLRVLQEREIVRVGGINPISIDVRIITATNRSLREMVEKGEFRKDLFYRLNVVPITVPPLRERKDEIPALTTKFMHVFNNQYKLNKRLDKDVLQAFMNYDWPGNVRELENIVERAVVTCPDDAITLEYCFPNLVDNNAGNNKMTEYEDFNKGEDLKTSVEKLEKRIITRALNDYGSTRKAAEALGVSQPTIVRKVARYGIKHSRT